MEENEKRDINMVAMEVIMNAGDGRDKIQSQVSGESMEYSLLFVHAQDTVMTITTELRMTQKLLPIVKMLLNKKGD